MAGLVLVDPTSEEFSARLGELAAGLDTPVPAATSAAPAPDEPSFAQMRETRAARTLWRVSLVVFSHGRASDSPERPPGWPLAEEERIWRELHADPDPKQEPVLRVLPLISIGGRTLRARVARTTVGTTPLLSVRNDPDGSLTT